LPQIHYSIKEELIMMKRSSAGRNLGLERERQGLKSDGANTPEIVE
jgi:hypothetical protein